MKKKNYWDKIKQLLKKYQTEWQGPDIPIYLFPMQSRSNFIFRSQQNKSGVSFPDKMFLFLTIFEDEKEMESLFVHEYHHVCRLTKGRKPPKQNTLLDSIILEGLAEHAVREHCGEKYCAKWCGLYSNKQLLNFWKKFFIDHLSINQGDPLHEKLLYGHTPYPRLVGYGLGYEMVRRTYENHHFTTKSSFTLPAKFFLKENQFFKVEA
ncbi:DUF2268 domain-containing putative Zn-dependent protease [Cytobacillus sp. Hz8]|uniref:DUF2268 domain-containing putative Zn-dependent protease n=1 Tax=Cytobacillus sp. Hz8 TaxID=3347168 RepID=UPI0035D98853